MKQDLKAEFDAAAWEHPASTESRTFVFNADRRSAVKVIDEQSKEFMTVREPE